MLKKAGIVVAVAAAAVVAATPFAFASDTDQRGDSNTNNTTYQNPVQACGNHIGITDGAFASLGKAENEQNNTGDCEQNNSSEN
ncbi:hypothetical protein [Pseudonocardia acaciae]|uniref:hypothetical protein n=1 Tax=Pseudonocardia acaciae TaxID=551276 RepID=UPI00048C9B62|nr:hypothetical protein [Pseudonocardia acaciae]